MAGPPCCLAERISVTMKNSNKFRNIEKIIGQIRKEYHFGKLRRKDLAADPLDQFAAWFLEAVKHCGPKANVMILATAGGQTISARAVLLKGFDEKGFLFYTHGQSRKARQIRENPRAGACFYWPELERQVTVTGPVTLIPKNETEIYFHSRPREAQIAAWCSEQSQVIENREELDRRFEAMKKKFEGKEIPLSPHWRGYRLEPKEFEFWQGRANRLNDRFRYHLEKGRWLIERLQP